MPYVHPAWLEHQRKRWTRENAHLWLRPDAERWLRPQARQFQPPNWQRLDDPDVKAGGVPETRAAEVDAETEALRWRQELAAIRFELALIKAAHLRRKYSPDQPRVPAGNPNGGQWTSGDGGGGPVGNTNNTEGQDTGSENPSGNDFNLGAVYAEAEAQGEPRVLSDATPDGVVPGARYAANKEPNAATHPRSVSEGQPASYILAASGKQSAAYCWNQMQIDMLYCSSLRPLSIVAACRSQAMERYAACLTGKPLPPLPF